LRSINKYRKNKTTVVNIYSSEVFWVTGGLIRDAAKACKINISWNISYNKRRHKVNPKYFFLKKSRNNGDLNLFIGHSIYFQNVSTSKNANNVVVINQIQDPYEFDDNSKIKSLNSSSKIILQNQTIKNFLIMAGVNPDLIEIFPGAIDRTKYFPGFSKKNFVLVSGDFKPRKNPESILQVIENNTDINFVIHGKNLAYFKDYEKNNQNLKLINWKGVNQPKLMRSAGVFMNLSLNEGGPISILEALSVGTPVIATDTGFAKELIKNEFGSVVPINFDSCGIRNDLNQWLNYSMSHIPIDFLNGEFSFTDYGLVLFD
jgi:glycosyltransferase involved in cell wall biosynthesis